MNMLDTLKAQLHSDYAPKVTAAGAVIRSYADYVIRQLELLNAEAGDDVTYVRLKNIAAIAPGQAVDVFTVPQDAAIYDLVYWSGFSTNAVHQTELLLDGAHLGGVSGLTGDRALGEAVRLPNGATLTISNIAGGDGSSRYYVQIRRTMPRPRRVAAIAGRPEMSATGEPPDWRTEPQMEARHTPHATHIG